MTERKPGHRSTSVLDLNLNPDNPRQGDVGAIVESIEANGFVGSIVAQCSTGNVLAGNHRLIAAKALGMTKVPVHWVDVDDESARRIMLADNRTSDLASYDEAALTAILADMAQLDQLAGTGFDGDDVDLLIADIETPLAGSFGDPIGLLDTDHECPRCGYEF